MNPHNSKIVTIIGGVGIVLTGIVGFPQWAALGNVGHVVVVVAGIGSLLCAVLGKALGSPS